MTPSKRYWIRLVAVLAALLLAAAACGEDDDDGNGADVTPGAEEPAFETLREGVLKVGSCLDYRPFEFVKDGDEQGFDVDLTEEIASRLGLEVEWVKANFDTIFTSLAADQFDMVAAASTITEERLEVVSFSDPYFNSRQALTVNSEERPDVSTIDDLGDGDTVGVQKGTTGKAFADENLAPNGVEIKVFDAAPDAFTDLDAGNVDGVINDEGSSIAEVEQRPGLEVVQAIDTDEHYGLPISQDNPELLAAVNDALADIIADGTYAQIFTEWFPDLPVPEEFTAS
ncbi:MAG: basic amino acid ABC transporter substrate-binding protein [Actinomycetota bacterium]